MIGEYGPVWFSKSEVVLHSYVSKWEKNLENKTKNTLNNGWRIRTSMVKKPEVVLHSYVSK